MTTEQFVQERPGVRPDVLMIANSDRMLRVLDAADRAAASDARVLVTGESGAGKNLIVRRLHARSARAGHPLVPVSCAAFTEAELESELFGRASGSFGGEHHTPGLLHAAHHGTVLLDGIGDVSLRLQARLLRFIETGELSPSGTPGGTRADVRIIAAASGSLSERVASGQFREDLLYRLRVIHLEVPPLRKRREDVAPLVAHFVQRIRPGAAVTAPAMRILVRYRWPGNVRELQNVLEQAAWVAAGPAIDVEHLPPAVRVAADAVLQTTDRRGSVSDELYDALIEAGYSFWDHIYPLFLSRDITRHDIRALVRRGLATTRGNYRGLLKLFGMPPEDYKRFLNFLAAHQCGVDFREYRKGISDAVTQVRTVPAAVTVAADLEDDAFARN